MIETGATTLGQSGTAINGKLGVVHTSQIFRTGTLSSYKVFSVTTKIPYLDVRERERKSYNNK